MLAATVVRPRSSRRTATPRRRSARSSGSASSARSRSTPGCRSTSLPSTSREIGSLMMRLGAHQMTAAMLADPALVRRHGFTVVRRGGMFCYSSAKLGAGVFNHVSGYGTFAPASQRGLDAVIRHYDDLGDATNIEVLVPAVSRADRALLVRNGFRDAAVIFQCHVRTTARAPRAREVRGLAIARAGKRDATRYAKLATRGFGGGGTISEVFERGWIRQIG